MHFISTLMVRKPNPGPGGAAFFSPDFNLNEHWECINHDTTINFCELFAIRMVYDDYLQYVRDCVNYRNKFCDFKNIIIFTDSKFVCDVMSINGYPEFDYYYNLLNDIFGLSNILSNYNVNIELVKIPSHSGINGNRMADRFANKAASISRDCKFNNGDFVNYNLYYNPINVDISKDLIKLRKWQKQQRRSKWILRHDRWLSWNLDDKIFTGDMIFHKMIINDGKIFKFENAMRDN